MDRNANDDFSIKYEFDTQGDQEDNQVKVEPSDIELPPYPRPSKTDSEITPHSTDSKEYPLKRKNSPSEERVSKKLCENSVYEIDDDSSSDAEDYSIVISDIPKDLQIRKYIEECDLVGDVDMSNDNNDVKLKFENKEDYHKVQKRLINDRDKGSKLTFKLSAGRDAEVEDNTSDTTEIIGQDPSKLHEDADPHSPNDPLGLYGLKPEFLRSLDITPPLERWVLVTNFRCDKFELRDVMELAGRVLSCSVVNINKRFARVQYSHPLEAVQAISMLNGQMYFGMKLNVSMEKYPKNDVILPKGLVNIGLGLGMYGKPIRDIANQYERLMKKRHCTINPILLSRADSDNSVKGEGSHKPEYSQIEFKEFISLKNRTFEVKHAEDLDSIDGIQSEKDFAKGNYSPESMSIKSVDSPISGHDVRETERSNDYNRSQNLSMSSSRGLPEVSGSTIPIRLRQASPSGGFPRQTIPQNVRPPPIYSARPGPSGPQGPMSANQYPVSFRPTSVNPPDSRPNLVPHAMPNPIGNPPRPGPFGLSQFRPQAPIGPNSVNNSGPVYGLASVYAPGAVHVPGSSLGIAHRPGPIHGPRPMPGPGSVHGPVHGSGPIQGPGPVQGSGSGPGLNTVSGTGLTPAPAPLAPPGTKVNVEFTNLPPSTTFPFLCEKLSQCGQVISLRFTTPGCAIATFGHPSHAERCHQNYNGMIVEGYRIGVTLV